HERILAVETGAALPVRSTVPSTGPGASAAGATAIRGEVQETTSDRCVRLGYFRRNRRRDRADQSAPLVGSASRTKREGKRSRRLGRRTQRAIARRVLEHARLLHRDQPLDELNRFETRALDSLSDTVLDLEVAGGPSNGSAGQAPDRPIDSPPLRAWSTATS